MFDPAGQALLAVDPQGQLRDLTMAGIFFESREPPSSEFSFADLEAAFPEGRYTVRAESFDGTILVGSAIVHSRRARAADDHLAPDRRRPKGTGQNPVPLDDLMIGWDGVTKTVDGGPVDITGYEVIVTKEDHDDPHGFSRPIYDVHVLPNVTGLPVPVEFLEADTVYEVEVLALEVSGNQTISVGFFELPRGKRHSEFGYPRSSDQGGRRSGIGHPGPSSRSSRRSPRELRARARVTEPFTDRLHLVGRDKPLKEEHGVSRSTARPASADLATLIAMADTDEIVRLRLLRAIRDLGAA